MVRESLPSMPERKLELLLDFLKGALQIDADRRLMPIELLRHPWLQDEVVSYGSEAMVQDGLP